MSIRAAVVEDDPAFCRTEADLIRSCGQAVGQTLEVDTFCSSIVFLQKYTAQYDIVVADAVLRGCNGIETARRVRLLDPGCLILFVASTPKFTLSGYQVNAFAYLLKPLSEAAFRNEFGRALRLVRRNEGPTIVLQEGASYYKVPLHAISYIESQRHRITVHSDETDITVTTTLSSLQAGSNPPASTASTPITLSTWTGSAPSTARRTSSTRAPSWPSAGPARKASWRHSPIGRA